MMGMFEKGQYVRVLHTDYAEVLAVGDIFKVGEAFDHGVSPEGEKSEWFFLNREIEPWVPNVGERVKVVKAVLSHKAACVGREFTVVKEAYKLDDGAQTWSGDNAGGYVWRTDELEPVAAASPVARAVPATLTIEAGRFYKTRDGRKVGPIGVAQGPGKPWPWKARVGMTTYYYKEAGFSCPGYADGHNERDDLVAEWVDEPKASNDNGATLGDILQAAIGKTVTVQISKPKFKVGDRVRVTAAYDTWQEKYKGTAFTIDSNEGDFEGEQSWTGKDDRSPYRWKESQLELIASSNPAIVCLIENGQPKPSSIPHVHADEAKAGKEAARLASVYKGKEFGVFVLTSSTSQPAPIYKHEWQRLASNGKKISAIKELRAANDLTLKGAKDAVEHWLETAA